MKNFSRFLTISSLAIAGSATFVGAGQAAALNANLGFSPIGGTTITGSNLQNATSVTLPSINVVNVIDPTYTPPGGSTNPNDFFLVASQTPLGTNLTLSPLTLPNLNTVGPNFGPYGTAFTIAFASGSNPPNRYTFTLDQLRKASSGLNELTLEALGTITDTGNPAFDPSAASFSLAFTQTGGGSINYSATIASPPSVTSTGVPEPSTVLALLAVAGAGAAVRGRKI